MAGGEATAAHADVSNRDQMESLFQQCVDTYGGVDICVPNAYYSHRAPFLELDWEETRRTVEVTMFGTFHACQLSARRMAEQGRGGKIVIISSVMAAVPHTINTSGPYNMSKGGVDTLAKTMASELVQHNITVNTIHPGWIDTRGERQFTSEAEMARLQHRLPLGIGRPEDVAEAALFMASSRADYVTGTTLTVDGGFTVAQRIPGVHADPVCGKPVHLIDDGGM
jgi:glucose 1-dehydrogenase